MKVGVGFWGFWCSFCSRRIHFKAGNLGVRSSEPGQSKSELVAYFGGVFKSDALRGPSQVSVQVRRIPDAGGSPRASPQFPWGANGSPATSFVGTSMACLRA